MVVFLRKIPWLSLILLWLTYIMLGWYLSIYHIGWSVFLLVVVFIFTIASLWSGKMLGRWIQLGPQSLLVVFLFSGTVCLAAILPTLFALSVMVFATQLLARVDMQAAGFRRNQTLWALTLTTALGLGLGWIVGVEETLPSVEYWPD